MRTPKSISQNLSTVAVFAHCIVLLLMIGCRHKQDIYLNQKPLPNPPTDWGIVTVYDSIAINVTDTLNDNQSYRLLNDAILPKGNLKNKKKLKNINITWSNMGGYLDNQELDKYFSTAEIAYFKSQAKNKLFVFDPSKLNNCVCISVKECLLIFDHKTSWHINWSYINWTYFAYKYGEGGLYNFSLPIFNQNYTKAIILTAGGGSSIRGKYLQVLFKKHEKWRIEDVIELSVVI